MTSSALPPAPASAPRVLWVGGDEPLAAVLRAQGAAVTIVPDSAGALAWLRAQNADILVREQSPADRAGEDLFRESERLAPGCKKILLTNQPELHAVIRTVNHQHVDFLLVHPVSPDQLRQAVAQTWSVRRLERERDALSAQNALLVEELRRFNSGLEQRVRERMDELAAANAKLGAALEEIERKNRALQLLNESLNIQATIDPLTGLFNRREFRNRLAAEWGRFKRHQRPMSLVMADIDHFKRVNDTHGHECGDAVLQALGGILRDQQRRHDVACRYGGEEFIVLLPETLLEAAFLVAEGIRRRIASHVFRYRDVRLEVTVSLGVAGAVEQNPANEDEFIKLADLALYRAKDAGRNRTVVLDASDRGKVARTGA
jgi:diguanylate cyclase (GGDEF)-like protein